MRRSYALRLAAAFAGVGIAAAALTAILVNVEFGTTFASYLHEQQDARERQLVAGLADSYRRADGWSAADLESLQSLALMDGGAVRVVDAQGKTVWDASAGVSGQMAALHRQMMGSGPLGPEQRLPIRVDGSVVGTAVIRLPQPGLLPQDVAFRSSVNRLLLLGGILAGFVALALGIVLARRATAPARELTKTARALALGDRSERVESEGPDEFGEMARAFNTLADTIEEEDRLRREFAADVAHELRTPLTILRTQIEGIQDGVVEPTSPALASLHEETLRLSRLVADLETLASADAARFSLVRQPVDLRPLLEGAAREFAGPYEAEDVRLAAYLSDVAVQADPTRIRQVVANLLSNALKFTPPGGEVDLTLRREGDNAVIRVSDTGPGIPADELQQVFDRFFRGRGARAGGSGIGLTVARELVRAHRGDIEVASELQQGTTFTVLLPLASSGERAPFMAPSHAPVTVGVERRR
ncbi:MAG: HAMP domain-containing protein [Actinobacteria bacterium]|nr:HAMP domain-containing protein [Actinomycetota bacterium]